MTSSVATKRRLAWGRAICRTLANAANAHQQQPRPFHPAEHDQQPPTPGAELHSLALVAASGASAVLQSHAPIPVDAFAAALARTQSALTLAPLAGNVTPAGETVRFASDNGSLWFSAGERFLHCEPIRAVGEPLTLILALPAPPGVSAVTSVGTVPATMIREDGTAHSGQFQHRGQQGLFRTATAQTGTSTIDVTCGVVLLGFGQHDEWLVGKYTAPQASQLSLTWLQTDAGLGLRAAPADGEETTRLLARR